MDTIRQEQDRSAAYAPADDLFQLPPSLAPSEDLTQKATAESISDDGPIRNSPAYEDVFDRICRVLHRRTAHHVLLVGERGVGQSAILAELALRIARGEIPFLDEQRVLSVDCRYVAPAESAPRLAAILGYLAEAENLIIDLDGFGKLLRGEGGRNNLPLLLSILSRMSCRVIGRMTPQDYDDLIAGDSDAQEFFARVDVAEPDPETAVELVRCYGDNLMDQYSVRIDEPVIRSAVSLSANYVFSERLPAKAVKILQSVCEDIDYERELKGSLRAAVTVDDVVTAVSLASGVPEETLRGIVERSDYEASLRESIVGQDHVIRDMATELGLIKSGLNDAGKPASVVMFVGQTGTGKTETAKALARLYSQSKRLKTYTLGNFIEPHSVSGIIGVPPGYVGHDAGGPLIRELNSDPYGVFLLDEADKAHPDVLQPFLNLFDEGWIVDQRGVKAYANHAIFILTTNVGQKMIADMASKGQTPAEMATRMQEALSQIKHAKANRPVFSPEFLARIKRVIVFNPLDEPAMEGICRKLIRELHDHWRDNRGKRLAVAEHHIAALAAESHRRNKASNGKEGGRIARKLISEFVDAPIQRAITDRLEEYRECECVAVASLPNDQSTEEPDHLETQVSFS